MEHENGVTASETQFRKWIGRVSIVALLLWGVQVLGYITFNMLAEKAYFPGRDHCDRKVHVSRLFPTSSSLCPQWSSPTLSLIDPLSRPSFALDTTDCSLLA